MRQGIRSNGIHIFLLGFVITTKLYFWRLFRHFLASLTFCWASLLSAWACLTLWRDTRGVALWRHHLDNESKYMFLIHSMFGKRIRWCKTLGAFNNQHRSPLNVHIVLITDFCILVIPYAHYDGRALSGNPGLQYPLCMVQCTHLITTGGTPHLYNRGSTSMQVNSLHSGANNV